MKPDATSFLPLSPAVLHILMALAGEERHGYGIMLEIARQTEGRHKIGPGTLYDNLKKLLDWKLVEESARRPAEDDDPRRRYYRLTAGGRAVLSAEITRLEQLVREARASLQPAKPRRA
jgi:DNA-binding PadR family transcriptional regulator